MLTTSRRSALQSYINTEVEAIKAKERHLMGTESHWPPTDRLIVRSERDQKRVLKIINSKRDALRHSTAVSA